MPGAPVVLSYGMGVDSTALLLRWLFDPSSRDFDLADLIVVTAMTGDEFATTGALVETYLLPLLRRHGIRFVQVARRGPLQADGIEVLSDSTVTTRVHLRGVWRLSHEMKAAGTVPQVASGRRLCSVKFKGWPLDTWLAGELAGRPFRHVMGFNADEQFRVDRDASYSDEVRQSEYPLLEWGWGRAFCEWYIAAMLGVEWEKSCCTYCPFARDNHLDRYRNDPAAAAEAMLIEHSSLALNPRSTLFSKKSVIKLVEADRNGAAVDRYHEQLSYAACDYALYEVRRIVWAKGGDPAKKGPAARSVRVLTVGRYRDVVAALRDRADRPGTIDSYGILRATLIERGDRYPAVEHELVVAPAGVEPKERPSFDGSWARLTQAG